MKHLARWMIVGGALGLLALGGACSSEESGGGPPPGVGGSGGTPELDGGAGAAGEDASIDALDDGSVGNDGAAGGDGATVNDGAAGSDGAAEHDGAAGGDAGHDGGAGGSNDASSDVNDASPDVASACATCMGASCATDTASCQADDNCECWRGCYDPNANNWGSCNDDCGSPGNPWFQYLQCSYQNCASECGATFDAGLGGFDGGFGLDGGFPFDSGAADAGPDCAACMTSSCGTESSACEGDATCDCWNACYDGTNFANCQSCGMPNDEWFSLMQCRASKCSTQCR